MKVLIIGGTGTMGIMVTKMLLKDHRIKITCMSRDEQKQLTMPYRDRVRMMLGDIRDKPRLQSIISSHFDYVINLAAQKCVESCEENPTEAIKTNLLGTMNLVDVCESQRFRPTILFTSTDKACYPINTYGFSKALAEKLVNSYSHWSIVFRYGNILGSRGSVIPTFVRAIRDKKPVKITDRRMTRFWASDIDIAAAISEKITNGNQSNKKNSLCLIQTKSMPVLSVARAIAKVMGVKEPVYETIGIQKGEKLHEHLTTEFDDCYGNLGIVKSDEGGMYMFDEFCTLIAPLVGKILHEIN